jgi:hypothetical protein
VDGDFEDPTATNWTSSLKSTLSKLNGNYGIEITGPRALNSNNYTFIDTSKRYKLEGYFKSAGSVSSKSYYGFLEYDKDFNPIFNYTVNTVV